MTTPPRSPGSTPQETQRPEAPEDTADPSLWDLSDLEELHGKAGASKHPKRVERSAAPRIGTWGTQKFMNRFDVRKRLGRGAMGEVVIAYDRQFCREVAMKLFLRNKERGADIEKQLLDRFWREAQVTSQLEHPNIVPIHEMGLSPDGRPYFTMKVVRGRSLRERIEELTAQVKAGQGEACFPLRERIEVLIKICDAIAFAHQLGVVHRDLKPENVLIGHFGEVQVMDWGLAKILDADSRVPQRRDSTRRAVSDIQAIPYVGGTSGSESDSAEFRIAGSGSEDPLKTQEGSIAGTPAFMSPEQARGETKKVGPAADQFALGGILYQLLTLTPPYRGKRVFDVVKLAAQGKFDAPSWRAKGVERLSPVPKVLEAVVLKATAMEPTNRYEDVQAFAADLRAYLADEPVSVAPTSALDRLVRMVRRRPDRVVIGSVIGLSTLAIVLVAASMLGIMQYVQQQSRLDRIERELSEERAARIEAQLEEETLRSLAQAGQIEELRKRLGVTLELQRSHAMEQFVARMNQAIAEGADPRQLVGHIGHEEAFEFLEAYEEARQLEEETGQTHISWRDHFHLALLHAYALGDTATAFEHFGIALEMERSSDVLASRAWLYAYTGQFSQAIDDLNEALQLDPGSVAILRSRAHVHAEAGRMREALADYDRLIAASGGTDDARWYIERAQLRMSFNDANGAIDDLSRALSRQPNHGGALLMRAQLATREGRWQIALTDWRRVIEMEPNRIEPYLGRAQVYAGQRRWREAEQDYTRAIELDHNHVAARYHRAEMRAQRGRYAEAVEDLALVISLEPNNWEAHLLMGRVEAMRGNNREAIRALERARRNAPQQVHSDIDRMLQELR